VKLLQSVFPMPSQDDCARLALHDSCLQSAFDTVEPQLWNNLHPDLREPDLSYSLWIIYLFTYLFRW